MCLTVGRSAEMLTAEEDIVCYKILKKDSEGYFTPYRDFAVDMDSKILKAEGEIKVLHFLSAVPEKGKMIEGGVIHTFELFEDADEEIFRSGATPGIYEIFKCIIPKGTKYYKGRFGTLSSYGSLCIKFVEKCMIS